MEPNQYVRDLRSAGMTQAEIAAELRCTQGYVSDLARAKKGKRLSYVTHSRLVKLWEERGCANSCSSAEQSDSSSQPEVL